MPTWICKSCGGEVATGFPVCRHCGREIDWAALGVGQNPKYNSLNGCTLVAAVGAAVFVLALMLGGEHQTDSRTLRLPSPAPVARPEPPVSSPDFAITREEPEEKLDFENVDEDPVGDTYVQIHGLLRNTGTKRAEFVKILVRLKDSEGGVLDSAETYAVTSDGINPGDARSWSVMMRMPAGFAKYDFRIVSSGL
jgi:hypothetical protein